MKTVVLSGTASDSDGTITTHQWKQIAGTAVTLTSADSATATFIVGPTEQTYAFSYMVTDNEGATATDETHVTVIINSEPTADAGADQSVTVASMQTITLSGTDNDSNGIIATRQWEQTAGTTVTLTGANTTTATFTVGPAPQTYTFTYTVADDDGATASDEVSVMVNLNSLPVVDAGTYPLYSFSDSDDRTVILTGTATDSDGTIESHRWVQTGGNTALTLIGSDTESVRFTVPATTDTFTFSYTATDDAGGQSTDTATVYVTSVIFSDSFSDSSSEGNWDLTNDDTGNGAAWTVANNNMQQNANVSSRAVFTDTSYHSGSYALLTHTSMDGVSDYRFSVIIRPLTNSESNTNTSEGNDVGIMFRYQDASNYYRVSMSARSGFTRFEKRVGGNFETLAVNARGYVDNQDLAMTAEISGDTIIVWIDGDPVFATVDSDITSGTVALFCQDRAWFDDVVITENSPQPVVAIVSPLAYSMALTPGDGTTLSAQAAVLNAPSGASVGFVLDDGSEAAATLSSSLYSSDLTGVVDGEHEFTAILRDGDGVELNSDTNVSVGVGGDYIITVGDSITNGVGDDDDWNNDSADGRIVSIQGFQAPLADAWSGTRVLPQIVFNEGIGGDESSDLNNRIVSILDRHPRANKVLMMIGTNDSGSGVAAGTFATTVGNIATIIDDTYGKQLWVAKPMPTYLSSDPTTLNDTRNTLIQSYITEIQLIVDADSSDGTIEGPDFFTLFDSTIYYFDYLHPNDIGYQLMADEWHDVLMAGP